MKALILQMHKTCSKVSLLCVLPEAAFALLVLSRGCSLVRPCAADLLVLASGLTSACRTMMSLSGHTEATPSILWGYDQAVVSLALPRSDGAVLVRVEEALLAETLSSLKHWSG